MVRTFLAVLLFSAGLMAQVLPVPSGGTGKTTLPAHGPVIGQGTGPVTVISPGTAGQCLISGGPSVDPVWAACPGQVGSPQVIIGTGSSPVQIMSPDLSTTYGIVINNGTDPTLTSSTGTIDIGSLLVTDLAGTGSSCLQTDASGNITRSGQPCGSGAGGAGQVTFLGVSDAVKDSTCSTTSGSANLTCSDAPFGTCPTGKTVSVTGGRTSDNGEPNSLITTIASCSSSTVAVLATTATRTASSTTARWGTDNGPALFALANAPTTAGKTLTIPPGNYLVNVTSGAISVQSQTAYDIMPAAHIYLVGPTGCSSNDTACPGIDSSLLLFWLPSATSGGAPNGTHNVLIQLDGMIEGDNTDANGVGVPYLNQSPIVAWVDGTSDNSSVTDITISGVGSVVNIYGFSFHGIGGSRNNVVGITHNHVAKGLNINSNNSIQRNNTFINSAGIEAAGSNISITGNHFDNSWGISVGGMGAGTVCTGYVVSGNSFANMTLENLELSQCPVGAVISGNSFWMPTNTGANHTAINVHDNTGAGDNTPTHDNLIVGNTFYAAPSCYAAVFTYGTATGGNVYSQNHMTGACLIGYVLNNYWSGHTAPDIIKNDTLIGTSADLALSASNNTIVQGAFLAGTGTVSDPSNLLNPTSWYNSAAGQKHMGSVSTGPLQGSQLTVGPQQTHTSVQRIVSSNSANYLDLDAPVTGNPTLTSSTGYITVSKLTIPTLAGNATLGTDSSGNLVPGSGGSGSGMIWPSGNAGDIPAYSGASGWQTSYSPTHQIPANMIASTTPLTLLFNLPSTYTVTATDFINCTTLYSSLATASTVTLPSTIPPSGQCVRILNYGSGNITVNHPSYTINASSAVLSVSGAFGALAPNAVKLVSDGAANLVMERYFSSTSWGAVQAGNLVSQALTVGNGASLIPAASSSGIISANQINGAIVPPSQASLASNANGQIIPGTGSGMVYPAAAGIANFNGTAWGTSFNTTTNPIPAGYISTLNQNTTGNAATATALAATPTQCTVAGQFATGVTAAGNANCATPAGSSTVAFSNITSGTVASQNLTVGSGSVLSPGSANGNVTANVLAAPNGGSGGMTGGTQSMPSSFTSGYLHYNGSALVWDIPTSSGAALSALTAATTAHSIANSNFKQTWQFNFTGTTANAGLALEESAVSTNTLASLLQVDTLSGSTAIPFQATAGGTANGLKVDSSGNVNAIGTAKLVGPIQLPSSLYSQASLATDSSGNIVAGTMVAPIYVFANTNVAPLASGTGVITTTTGTNCVSGVCSVVTPSLDTTYRITGVMSVVTATSSGCTAGSIGVQVLYTDADSNTTPAAYWTLAGSNLGAAQTLNAGFAINNAAVSQLTIYSIAPRDIRVLHGSTLKMQVAQTAAMAGTCSPLPVVAVRFAVTQQNY